MYPHEEKVSNISSSPSPILKSKLRLRLAHDRTIHWMGGVNYENYLDITDKIKECLNDKPNEAIHLIVTSPGGPSGVGLSFYDMMRRVYHANLCTIGTGDVDSSGIIIFLSGKKRFLTPNTTLLLHLAGRIFDHSRRFTTLDLEYMMKEDKLKDYQYATVIAEESGGKLTTAKVLDLMAHNTVLTPTEAVQLGLAHGII